jgi:hypothetical protein
MGRKLKRSWMAVPQKQFEPIKINAGDTLSWIRFFSDYPASAGWQLVYEIRGQGQAIEFKSTASGDSHVILVASNVTLTWLPQSYVMVGYAENVATGERRQVYENSLTIAPNFENADPALDTRTHAQKMVELIQGVQLGKFKHDILESDVELTRIRRLTPKDLRDEYNYWVQIRSNEIKAENSKNGRSNQRNRFEVFVDPAVSSVGQFGALPPLFPYGGTIPGDGE